MGLERFRLGNIHIVWQNTDSSTGDITPDPHMDGPFEDNPNLDEDHEDPHDAGTLETIIDRSAPSPGPDEGGLPQPPPDPTPAQPPPAKPA